MRVRDSAFSKLGTSVLTSILFLAAPLLSCWGVELISQKEDGSFRLWHIENEKFVGLKTFTPNHANQDKRWRLVGSIKMNQAGVDDLLFQYHDGLLAVWFMDGTALYQSAVFQPDRPNPATSKVVASEDFNKDGKADLLFLTPASFNAPAKLFLWLMNGPYQATLNEITPHAPPADIQYLVAADFDVDGHTDLAFQHRSGSKVTFWKMATTNRVSETVVDLAIGPRFKLVCAARNDSQDSHNLVFQDDRSVRLVNIEGFKVGTHWQEVFLPDLEPKEMIVGTGTFPVHSKPPAPPQQDSSLHSDSIQRLSRWLVVDGSPTNTLTQSPGHPDDGGSMNQLDDIGLSSFTIPAKGDQSKIHYNFPDGIIRFRYKPLWNRSHTIIGRGVGEGAKNDIYLLQTVHAPNNEASGGIRLVIDKSGDKITFESRDHIGHRFVATYNSTNAFRNHAQFQSNSWSEFTLITSSNHIQLRQDDRILISTNTAQRWPISPRTIVHAGLQFGNSETSPGLETGYFNHIECFSGSADASNVSDFVVSASVAEVPTSVSLSWKKNPFIKVHVRRRELFTENWSLVGSNVFGGTFRDVHVTLGKIYEYSVYDPSLPPRSASALVVPVAAAPPLFRGSTLLLVDDTLVSSLKEELQTLEKDLVGDGWSVITTTAPRHDDQRWASNPGRIAETKRKILSAFSESNRTLRQVVLIGHVAVPYSGFNAEDGHTGTNDNHYGAWSTDLYYADLNGNWTDYDAYPLAIPTSFPETMNQRGDGKFDQSQVAKDSKGESKIEVAVGRIDFSNLHGYLGRNVRETTLLKRYLDKAHRYKHGQLVFERGLLNGGFSHAHENQILEQNSVHLVSRHFLDPGRHFLRGDVVRIEARRLWAFQAGFGYVNVMNNNQPNSWSSEVIANLNPTRGSAFYLLSGSWFGDWNLKGNLMRACLANENSGLASFWMRGFLWRFDATAAGLSIGDAFMHTANDTDQIPMKHGAPRTLCLLGDPTLRSEILAPVQEPRMSVGADARIILSWKAPSTIPAGYLLLSATTLGGPYTNLIATLAADAREFSLSTAQPRYYAIRSWERITNGSGCYTNLSQAAYFRRKIE